MREVPLYSGRLEPAEEGENGHVHLAT